MRPIQVRICADLVVWLLGVARTWVSALDSVSSWLDSLYGRQENVTEPPKLCIDRSALPSPGQCRCDYLKIPPTLILFQLPLIISLMISESHYGQPHKSLFPLLFGGSNCDSLDYRKVAEFFCVVPSFTNLQPT
jgi:hypothetical protein